MHGGFWNFWVQIKETYIIRTLGSIFQEYKVYLDLSDKLMKVKFQSIQCFENCYLGPEKVQADDV